MTTPAAASAAARERRRRARRRHRARRSGAFRRLVPLAAAALGALSWRRAQAIGALAGRFLWRVEPRRRERALAQLALALPELAPGERRAIARRSLAHQATTLAESLHLLGRGTPVSAVPVEVDGFDHLERLLAARRPVLLVTGHCGNWELISAALTSRGVRVFAVARELQDPVLHEAVVRLRRGFGIETVVRGSREAAGQMRAALRGRSLLAVLIDQDIDVRGAWVPFFDRPAWTPLGPAQLALRFGLSAVPAFDERRADGSHLVRFHPRLDLPADPVAATAMMTRSIEEHVRRCPDQWVWSHRRWRRQPAAADGSGRFPVAAARGPGHAAGGSDDLCR